MYMSADARIVDRWHQQRAPSLTVRRSRVPADRNCHDIGYLSPAETRPVIETKCYRSSCGWQEALTVGGPLCCLDGTQTPFICLHINANYIAVFQLIREKVRFYLQPKSTIQFVTPTKHVICSDPTIFALYEHGTLSCCGVVCQFGM